MDKFLIFTIVGLSLAAIYAIIASGLVLTYTTTGIFNFAHGAIGMLAAFTYWQLRFDWGWPTPVALLVVLFVAGARCSALLLERVIMRGLVGTSEATKLVVSISLLVGHDRPGQPHLGAGREPADGAASSRASRIDLGVTTITYHQAITIGDGDRGGRRPALPALPHPHRRLDAGQRRRPLARAPQRGPARPGRAC